MIFKFIKHIWTVEYTDKVSKYGIWKNWLRMVLLCFFNTIGFLLKALAIGLLFFLGMLYGITEICGRSQPQDSFLYVQFFAFAITGAIFVSIYQVFMWSSTWFDNYFKWVKAHKPLAGTK